MPFLQGEKVRYMIADLRKFKVRKSQKNLVRKSQIRKVPILRNVRKSNKFADLRFAELICGPTTFDLQIEQLTDRRMFRSRG
jgi:hypothetical protein